MSVDQTSSSQLCPVKLTSLQVVITTYQTLNSDFITPSDIPSDEEAEWLLLNGYELNSDCSELLLSVLL